MTTRSRILIAAALWAGTLTATVDARANTVVPPDEAAPALEPVDVVGHWREAMLIESMLFTQPDLTTEQIIAALIRASALFERVAEAPGGRPDGYWHASRAIWMAGELLPLDDTAGRVARFRASLELAERGLEADPMCAACMLWKFTAMGRLRTTEGVFDGLRQIKEMADLLERGIALEPRYRDNDLNSTLGNLHYASAVYYRILPDWFWVRWVIGVRGDKERALEHSRRALALHPTRLDYKIELGTQLLCLGSTGGRHREKLEAGRQVIADAIAAVPANDDEAREVFFARQLMAEPSKACGYTGDGVLEIDEDAAKQANAARG